VGVPGAFPCGTVKVAARESHPLIARVMSGEINNRQLGNREMCNSLASIYQSCFFLLGGLPFGRTQLVRKRLTNTPVLQEGSVLKYPDDRKNRVVSAQATYPCGSSAVGGRVCEQRYAAQRVLPESRFELQHTGSPSKEKALEEKA
jgi:hypothetical protein